MTEATAAVTPLDRVMELYEKDDLVRRLGITIVSVEAGRVELALEPNEDTLNSHALVHGGMVFILADTAFAYAFASHGRPAVTTQGEIAYLAPALSGVRLTAVAAEVHRKGAVGIYDVLVTDTRGEAIASFRGQGRIPRAPAA
ncbi:MAG: phenylacetic acid degradation protein PaaD [Subtercola sp.]|jgi:acyl-CoA thioesterase|nr:phenylacetic acid degradation protein PaaD [Subtercola sp.]